MREIGISPRFSRDKFVPLQTKQRYSTRDISGEVSLTLFFRGFVPFLSLADFVSRNKNLQVADLQRLKSCFGELVTATTRMRLDDNDFQRVGKYFGLIWEVIHKPSFSMQTVEYLLSAVMNDLAHMREQVYEQKKMFTRAEQQMQQFTDLVAMYGMKARNVVFYAQQMHLTSNHLSALVRKHSGRSVMQWLNERTILEAKVLLRYTDRPISDIAFELNFTEATLFSRFFRRETGLSPRDYRSNK